MTKTLDSYETALLAELRTYVAERQVTATRPRRTWKRVAFAGIAAAAAAGIAVVSLPGAGPAPAYAVTEGGDGRVHVTVSALEDASGLEDALAEHGIAADVTYLPAGQTCDMPRFTPAPPPADGTMIGIETTADGFGVDLPADIVGDGQTLVIASTEPGPVDPAAPVLSTTSIGVAQGAVAACVPVPVTDLADSAHTSSRRG